MHVFRFFAAIAVSIFLGGCVAPPKYNWGNYDKSLYGYYKDPTSSGTHIAELESIVLSSEKLQGKVAPGLHAEYGYFLLQQGKSTEAVAQFEKEKMKWPESTQLMNTMIKLAETKASKPMASKE